MASALFSFPNPVNEVAARAVAGGVTVMAILAIATRQPWICIALAYGFVARVLAGPRFSPLGQLATRVVAPRLPRRARLVPGPPKRFAQGIGAAFTLSALGLWLSGHVLGTYIVLGVLIVPASLEAGIGLCTGCEVFALLMRAGLIPTSVCEECTDLYGPAARARRRAAAERASSSTSSPS